jgi:tetratricopeptide (TPR) repeat protein
MQETEAEKLFTSGLNALAQGNTLTALTLFEKAVQKNEKPSYCCYLALCIAKERGQFQLAVTLCEKAKAQEPQNSLHYLNLGKIYLYAGKTDDAIRTFREGLIHEKDQAIIEELGKLTPRKPPVISFLKRNNPVNRFLGTILKKLGIR